MTDKWKILSSEEIFSTKTMKLRVEKCELPDGRIMPRYYVVDFPHWVHVVGVTTSKELILLRQYRHAAAEVFWEIPGGTLDAEESNPLSAAQRELREETGYTSKNWKLLGLHSPNPAIQTNQIYTYLAVDCEKTHDLQLDPYEVLEVQLKSLPESFAMLKKGEFTHSLMAASLVLAEPHLSL